MKLRSTLLALALVGGAAGAAAAAPAPSFALPFLEDDYASALQQARARQVPIFLDAWAPW